MASHVVRKLDRATGERLREELEQAGFEMREAPYAVFAAKGPGVSVTFYEKGKLLVQGGGADDFAATYLDDPDQVAAAAAAAPVEDRVEEPIIGCDESGKGDYFGPLVVAAMLVRPDDVPVLRTLGVRDSKEMRDGEAQEVARQLHDGYGDRIEVLSIGPQRYNELYDNFGRNLNRLLAWGHGKAIAEVHGRHPCDRVLSDKFGNEKLVRGELERREIDVRLDQRVRAESNPAVAAASILARARFLRELDRLGRRIGAKLRKGAGTPVDDVARRLYRDGGIEGLRQVAKMHFKTTQKAMRGGG